MAGTCKESTFAFSIGHYERMVYRHVIFSHYSERKIKTFLQLNTAFTHCHHSPGKQVLSVFDYHVILDVILD